MNAYNFSADWTIALTENAARLWFSNRYQPLTYLEIGVFEGRSACWMLDNILLHPDSRYVGIDRDIKELALQNLDRHASKVELYQGESADVLPSLDRQFDIVYVDGSHEAREVLIDSVYAWRLSREFILWDDYRNPESIGVWKAVRCFLDCVPSNEYVSVVDNWQRGIKKFKRALDQA